MAYDLTVEDRQTALDFISGLGKHDIPWYFTADGRIRTKKFSYNGRCPLEGRYAEEEGHLVGPTTARIHYGLSSKAGSAIMVTADGDRGSEFREAMLVATHLNEQ